MADDGRDASTASRKRPSPVVEFGGRGGARRGSGSDRGDSRMIVDHPSPSPVKRPRTTDSPARPSPSPGQVATSAGAGAGADSDDPYAFPDDDQITKDNAVFGRIQSKPVSPLATVIKLPATPRLPSTTSSASLATTAETHSSHAGDACTDTDAATGHGHGAVEKPVSPLRTVSAEPDTATADTVMGGTSEGDGRPSIGEKKPPSATFQAPPPMPDAKLRQPQKLKRLREQHERDLQEMEQQTRPKKALSDHEQAHQALRRALVLALDHVGFSSATDNALESFLLMTESYLQSLASDVSRFTLAGRRNHPIPLDFDTSLARFNIGTNALRPHLRNPIPRAKLMPAASEDQLFHVRQRPERCDESFGDLPLLSSELSGKLEKDAKPYIPGGFPDFPSIHTYRHTPVDVDTVTVQGSGLRYDDGTMLLLPNEEPTADDRELGLGGSSSYGPLLDGATLRNNDPKRIREAAAVEAKQAEEALRGLMRASKVNKLKEVRAAADRNALSKQRYTLWEAAMRELIAEAKQKKGGAAALGPMHNADEPASKAAPSAAAALRDEIADQSMMVNSEKVFHRKEIPRKARKAL